MRITALSAALVLGLAAVARAERLPIQTFTIADGLAHDRVKCIFRDSRGIMWFCSSTGVDWFDGQRFSGHLLDERLAVSTNDILEGPDHTYWIATNVVGIVRLDPAGGHLAAWPPPSGAATTPRLRTYVVGDTTSTNRVNKLFRDRDGVLWAGTDNGLFRFDASDAFRRVALPINTNALVQIWAFAQTRDGSLWIGSTAGLFRRAPNGAIASVAVRPNGRRLNVWALLVAGDGTLWIGDALGLSRARPDAHESGTLAATAVDTLPSPRAASVIHQAASGVIWVGYLNGPLLRYDGREFHTLSAAQGLPEVGIRALMTDAEENVWVASGAGGGVLRILKNGFVTFGGDDGVQGELIDWLFETTAGGVCGLSSALADPILQCFDGQRFVGVRLRIPGGWQGRRRTLQARDGSWWFGTAQGVYRFRSLAKFTDLADRAPSAVYGEAEGVRAAVRGLFEDSRGDMWIWSETANGYAVSKWLRASDKIVPIEAIPPSKQTWEIAEDDHGGIWFGFRDGGLGRMREGRLQMIGADAGVPEATWIGALFPDRHGRLWVADTSKALGPLRCDEPWRDHPRFTRYTTAQEPPQGAGAFTEDHWGNLYVSTGYGIDRMDLERRWTAHYDMADGLADGQVFASLASRSGALWFGTFKGIARLIPERVDPPLPPETRIQTFRIAGLKYPLSMLGEIEVPPLSIPVGHSPIDIEFASAAGNVQYQHRLDGVDRDWQRPTSTRAVAFANLPAGSYRFEVRAIRRSGLVVGRSATVAFTIVPAFWQRGWFLAAVILTLTAVAYAIHRYRVGQLVAVERIRTRIATDLHDDIGSSLSRIAILSEVVARKVDPRTTDVVATLDTISATAGEIVDSMSDIVWAINPHHDALTDLTGRMRRFASDLLTAKNIAIRFDAPDRDGDLRLSPDVRREVYLTFKEALHNIVRHAGCTAVTAELRITDGSLDLTVSDNGKGFDPLHAAAGHGLASVRARARAVGGEIDLKTAPGHGTSVHLRLPLRMRRPTP